MAVQQMVSVSCPNCRAQFTAPVQGVIDARDPAQKSALLQGRINVIQCPQCGFASPLGIPMLYYDPDKELALAYVPNGLTMSNAEQEKMIGSLTNSLINSLPAEQRKFYILNPRVFLSFDSLVKAVLEADGITEEDLKAQEAKVRLIEEFLQAGSEDELKAKVKAHDAELDQEFFEILTASVQAAQMEGNQGGAQALYALRTMVARWSSQGRQAVAEIDQRLGQMFLQSQDELLEKLQAAGNEQEFDALVAAGHPLLDYTFFQKLTAKIDEATKTGDAKTARALKELRTRVVDTKARHEEMGRAALKQAAELLKQILQSKNPEKLLQQKLDEIDDAFFIVLSANITEARRQNQEPAAKAMEQIGNMAMELLRQQAGLAAEENHAPENQPPAASEILIGKK